MPQMFLNILGLNGMVGLYGSGLEWVQVLDRVLMVLLLDRVQLAQEARSRRASPLFDSHPLSLTYTIILNFFSTWISHCWNESTL